MALILRPRLLSACLGTAALACLIPLGGCGSATGSKMLSGPPVSVMLALPTLTLEPGGATVTENIYIASPSETAQVSFVGLPGGVAVKYAASDTSPSGTLRFTAASYTTEGSYKVKVTALTAGETASASFTLAVEK